MAKKLRYSSCPTYLIWSSTSRRAFSASSNSFLAFWAAGNRIDNYRKFSQNPYMCLNSHTYKMSEEITPSYWCLYKKISKIPQSYKKKTAVQWIAMAFWFINLWVIRSCNDITIYSQLLNSIANYFEKFIIWEKISTFSYSRISNVNILMFLCSSMTANGISLGCGKKRDLSMSPWALGNTDGHFSAFSDIYYTRQLIIDYQENIWQNNR